MKRSKYRVATVALLPFQRGRKIMELNTMTIEKAKAKEMYAEYSAGVEKHPSVRFYVDMAKIRMPVMKHIVYNKLLALYSEQMRILSVAGITITRSMEIVARIIGNDVFKIAIESSLQDISAGSNISDAMKKHVVFPRMMTRMVFIGESSGSLDEQFGYLSEYYLKKLDDVAQRIGKMIEPIVIVIIGLMFVFMIVGLLMPIYDLVTKMK